MSDWSIFCWKIWVASVSKKPMSLVPALASWWTRKARNVCTMDWSWFWNPCFSITTDWFLLSRSQSNVFYLCWNIPSETFDFLPCSAILMDQKSQKMLLNFHASIFKLKFLQLYLLQFPFKMSIDSFFTWRGLFKFKDHESCKVVLFFLIGIFRPKMAKVFLV